MLLPCSSPTHSRLRVFPGYLNVDLPAGPCELDDRCGLHLSLYLVLQLGLGDMQVSHRLQLRSLWRTPAAAVSR